MVKHVNLASPRALRMQARSQKGKELFFKRNLTLYKKDRASPCYQDEDVICWVARPREKTILVKYMFVVQEL